MRYIEDTTLELKRHVVSDIRKTVIAFANTAGGTIYIGIDDDGKVVDGQDMDGRFLTGLLRKAGQRT